MKWPPGSLDPPVIEKLDEPRSYLVKTDEGVVYQRNRRHLIPRVLIDDEEDQDQDGEREGFLKSVSGPLATLLTDPKPGPKTSPMKLPKTSPEKVPGPKTSPMRPPSPVTSPVKPDGHGPIPKTTVTERREPDPKTRPQRTKKMPLHYKDYELFVISQSY